MLPGNGKSEWFKDHPLGPEMAIIPKGHFLMGSPTGEEGRYDDEGPQHQVAIKAPFALGRFAVTLANSGPLWRPQATPSTALAENPGFSQTARGSRMVRTGTMRWLIANGCPR